MCSNVYIYNETHRQDAITILRSQVHPLNGRKALEVYWDKFMIHFFSIIKGAKWNLFACKMLCCEVNIIFQAICIRKMYVFLYNFLLYGNIICIICRRQNRWMISIGAQYCISSTGFFVRYTYILKVYVRVLGRQ